MLKRVIALFLSLFMVLILSAQETMGIKTNLVWFVPYGSSYGGITVLNRRMALVERFNQGQNEINLSVTCACYSITGYEQLASLIESGNAPDIVGPISLNFANYFAGEWLDLQPYITSGEYEMIDVPTNILESSRRFDGTLIGVPFMIYPGILFYNVDMFDNAGLHHPPTKADEPYLMPDGTTVLWDYHTVAKIASLLTLDKHGNTAEQPNFDPHSIVQYGFNHQWLYDTSNFSTFGSAQIYDGEHFNIPLHWREQAHWQRDAVWKYHFMPPMLINNERFLDLFGDGRLAMNRSMMWYLLFSLDDSPVRWDIAIQPAYNDFIYAPSGISVFLVHKNTKDISKALAVLNYLTHDVETELIDNENGFPVNSALHQIFLAKLALKYPHVKNWSVILDSILLSPVPHYELDFPNYRRGEGLIMDFYHQLGMENGATLNVDAELDALENALESVGNR